jgi:protein-S-isoprenylcysteine O-methyltransferase Ste14
MHATRFEYRFRFWIECLIYALGFTAPWTYLPVWNSGLTAQANNEPAWLAISTLLFRQGWLTYNTAVMALLIVALVLTALGAWFRLWGAAYSGTAAALPADGPYRRTRNPLHLGLMLHTIGIAILMPPSGAFVAIVLMCVFEVRLALAEETVLAARFGEGYRAYEKAVPRFLPTPTPLIAPTGVARHWFQAVFGEIYFVGAFLTLAIFGWGFDRTVFRQGLLISLGVAIIARAFVPRTPIPRTEDPPSNAAPTLR